MATTNDTDTPRVVQLAFRNPDRQPPLTDAELSALRSLLVSHSAICEGCPTARRILWDMEG